MSVESVEGTKKDAGTIDLDLSGCPVTGVATLDKTAVTGCTGKVTISNLANVDTTKNVTYKWTYTGTSSSTSATE